MADQSDLFMNKTLMSAAPPQEPSAERSPRNGSDALRRARGRGRGAAGVQFPARHHRRGQAHRQIRRPRGHALSARAQRLPALRSRQVDHPELRPRRARTAAPATCASTTPIRSRRTSSSRTRSPTRCAGSASTGARIAITRPTTTTTSTRSPSGSSSTASRTSTASRPSEMRATARHADRAGQRQPLPRVAASPRTSISSGG